MNMVCSFKFALARFYMYMENEVIQLWNKCRESLLKPICFLDICPNANLIKFFSLYSNIHIPKLDNKTYWVPGNAV